MAGVLDRSAKIGSVRRLTDRTGAWSLAPYEGASFTTLASLGVEVYGMSGVGFGPLEHVVIDDLHQDTEDLARLVVLRCAAQSRTPSLMVQLLDLLKPDRAGVTDRTTPAILRYTGTARSLDLRVVLLSPPEVDDQDALIIRLVAYDPYWYGTSDVSFELQTYQELGTSAVHERSTARVWGRTAGGPGGAVECLSYGPDGLLYAGGAFGVKVWNGTSWAVVGGNVNGTVYAMCWLGSVLYVAGSFTLAGGSVAVLNVASWNGSAWGTVGGGTAGPVYALCFAVIDGQRAIYAGTDGAQKLRVFFVDDLVWEDVESFNGAVRAIVRTPLGGLYVGGDFTLNGATSIVRVSYFSGYQSTPVALGSGQASTVRALLLLSDGRLLAGGNFGAQVWNGVAWSALALSGIVHDFAQSSDGVLVSNNSFSVYRWTGSTVLDLDILPSGSNSAVAVASDGRIAVGFPFTIGAEVPGITSHALTGSAAVWPELSIEGGGFLSQFGNITAGVDVYFSSLYTVTGETLALDFEAGTVESDLRGDQLSFVNAASSFSGFQLLPGTNSISFLDGVDSDHVVTCTYRPRYWSLDSADV